MTGDALKEYVLVDQEPKYKLKFANDNPLARFFGFVLQGFLEYAGFKCSVSVEHFMEKGKSRIEYIVSFHQDVFDAEAKK